MVYYIVETDVGRVATKMRMVILANEWEESFIYPCFQIPQDLEGMDFSTVKFSNDLLNFLLLGLSIYLYIFRTRRMLFLQKIFREKNQ